MNTIDLAAYAALEAERDALDAELIKHVDISIALERDRDQCARERDAYKAERDALAARLIAVEAALAPALEAEQGTTPGEWYEFRIEARKRDDEWVVRSSEGFYIAGLRKYADARDDGSVNARLIAAAVNAIRAVKALEKAD